MNNYDISILKRNIKKMMEEHKPRITQEMIASAAGMPQSQVSKVLSETNSNCFTISQLVNIAEFFHVSVDDLLGLKSENKKETKYETYSDIFKIFFSLDNYLDITIRDMTISDIYGSDCDAFPGGYDPRFDSIIQRALSFSDDIIINVLGEWRTAVEEMEQLTGGKKLYETWKQGILSEYNFKIGSQSLNFLNDIAPNSDTQKIDSFKDIPDVLPPY